MEIFTTSPGQTKKLGKILAKEIWHFLSSKKALVLGLEGDLGGGKTTFLQGLAKGLGIREKILSPTFVIMRKFPISNGARQSGRVAGGLEPQFLNFYHIDCYRIEKSKEILDLGFKEIISNPKNIVAIEWADRIQKILPGDTIIFKFSLVAKKKRKIMIKLKND